MTAAAAARFIGGRRDEDAILRAMLAEVTPDWFYEFEDENKKKAWGFGKTGVMEYARIRGELGFPIRFNPSGISVSECMRDRDRGIQATVVVRDVVSGSEGIGHAFYPHYTGDRNDPERQARNDRAALSVAKRNAILDLIPEYHVHALLKARTTVAKENWRRFETDRRAAQAEQMKSAARIPRLTPEGAAALVAQASDPYSLGGMASDEAPPAVTSTDPTAP